MNIETNIRRGGIWPGMIFVLIGLNVIGTACLVIFATADKTAAVEPQFYDKAVKWDEQARLLRHAEELNWRFAPSVSRERDAGGKRVVSLKLTNAEGTALAGGRVVLEAFHQADSGKRVELVLEDRGEGSYSVPAAIERPGYWEFRFRVMRGPDALAKVMTVSVADSKAR